MSPTIELCCDRMFPKLEKKCDAISIKLSLVTSHFSFVVLFPCHIWLMQKGSPEHSEWELWGQYPFFLGALSCEHFSATQMNI